MSTYMNFDMYLVHFLQDLIKVDRGSIKDDTHQNIDGQRWHFVYNNKNNTLAKMTSHLIVQGHDW
jgi:hypothetical protein